MRTPANSRLAWAYAAAHWLLQWKIMAVASIPPPGYRTRLAAGGCTTFANEPGRSVQRSTGVVHGFHPERVLNWSCRSKIRNFRVKYFHSLCPQPFQETTSWLHTLSSLQKTTPRILNFSSRWLMIGSRNVRLNTPQMVRSLSNWPWLMK